MGILGMAADAVMPRWQRLLIVCALGVLVLSAIGGSAFYQGWSMRGDREAAAALKLKEKTDALLAAEKDRGDKLAGDLEQEKRNIKTRTVEVIKEIPKVTTVYKESPSAPLQPIPDAVYTVGFVRLWNDAYAGLAMRPGAGGPAGPSGESDLVRARVSSADILANHGENAGKHAECYRQLNALIDFELGRASGKGE